MVTACQIYYMKFAEKDLLNYMLKDSDGVIYVAGVPENCVKRLFPSME